MGVTVQVRVLDRAAPGDELDAAAAAALDLVGDLDRRWSRFRDGSELSRLNRDPAPTVAVSAATLDAIAAALAAAAASGGLVDPCLGAAIVAAGYDRDAAELDHAAPQRVLRHPAPCVPARPAPGARWRAVHVDRAAGTVTRPPGTILDLGGIGKGLAADLVVALLGDREHVVADVGGDLAVGGTLAEALEQPVAVADPAGGLLDEVLAVRRGAAATSGVTRRAWWHDGRLAHHLLDPSTGRPATTGVLQATALAPSAAEAERRAKQAVLGGPAALADALGEHGGVAVLTGRPPRVVRVG
jgi:thiamine biosynthesis lipoprotein